jgi:hypothetical protein
MADHCLFCDTRRPEGGTQILVLNEGEFWAEFCPECGATKTLQNKETGEEVTVAELFRRCGGVPTPPDPARVAARQRIQEEQERWRKEWEAEEAVKKAKLAAQDAARRSRLRGGLNQPVVLFGTK